MANVNIPDYVPRLIEQDAWRALSASMQARLRGGYLTEDRAYGELIGLRTAVHYIYGEAHPLFAAIDAMMDTAIGAPFPGEVRDED